MKYRYFTHKNETDNREKGYSSIWSCNRIYFEVFTPPFIRI